MDLTKIKLFIKSYPKNFEKSEIYRNLCLMEMEPTYNNNIYEIPRNPYFSLTEIFLLYKLFSNIENMKIEKNKDNYYIEL